MTDRRQEIATEPTTAAELAVGGPQLEEDRSGEEQQLDDRRSVELLRKPSDGAGWADQVHTIDVARALLAVVGQNPGLDPRGLLAAVANPDQQHLLTRQADVGRGIRLPGQAELIEQVVAAARMHRNARHEPPAEGMCCGCHYDAYDLWTARQELAQARHLPALTLSESPHRGLPDQLPH